MKKIFNWKLYLPLGIICLTIGAFFAPGSLDEVGKTKTAPLVIFILAGLAFIFLAFSDLGIVRISRRKS